MFKISVLIRNILLLNIFIKNKSILMLKIKRKYLGKTIMKEGKKLLLTENLSQKELEYIKNMFSEGLVQVVKEKEEEIKDDNNK